MQNQNVVVGSGIKFVTCPKCHAKPGDPCKTKGGGLYTRGLDVKEEHREFHDKRVGAFLAFRRGR